MNGIKQTTYPKIPSAFMCIHGDITASSPSPHVSSKLMSSEAPDDFIFD